MIATVADLLEAFRQKEAEQLDKQQIRHAPTIGAMYEGLTRNILTQSLPEDVDLRVVSGFITNDQGVLSAQVDCMLVVGDGTTIPFTDTVVYHFRNVIAVLEVKKRLYAGQLAEAYQNMISVQELRDQKQSSMREQMFIDAYRLIVQNHPPLVEEAKSLPTWKQQIYYTLAEESVIPVRIVLGYHGYAKESTFRQAFMDYLEQRIGQDNSGPISLPNLIICERYSLIKLNGMPYAAAVRNEYWPVYASLSGNPLLPLLEMIWTRLVYDDMLDNSVFGEDLLFQQPKLLLSAKAVDVDTRVGWKYRFSSVSQKALETTPPTQAWQPAFLSDHEAVILGMLLRDGELNLKSSVADDCRNAGHPLPIIVDSLLETGLVTVENDILSPLTTNCRIAVLPDGSIVAGEDISGRFTNWLMQYNDSYGANPLTEE